MRPSSWLGKGRAVRIEHPLKSCLGQQLPKTKGSTSWVGIYLQLCRHRCSSNGLRNSSVGQCLARNITEGLPLRSSWGLQCIIKLYLATQTREVSGFTQGVEERLFLIYNSSFKPEPRMLKLTLFIYFALMKYTPRAYFSFSALPAFCKSFWTTGVSHLLKTFL